MGNRAVIAFSHSGSNRQCIYLHWNGGRASVEGFLSAAKIAGIVGDSDKSIAKIAEMIATHFFDVEVNQLNVYTMPFGQSDQDNWDNGVYFIDEDLDIVGRKFVRSAEEIDREKTSKIISQINESRAAQKVTQ